MGSACCVAARDRTITNGSGSDVMPRNIRYSPSWSVRWDNRRRVAGEEASMTWFSNGVVTNDRLDNKSQTTAGTVYASEEDQSVSQFTAEVKESTETQLALKPSPTTTSSSTHSVSSLSASPLTFYQSQLLNESNRGSHGGSSDSWSVPAFNELMATSHKERWSFDNESLNSNHDNKVNRCSGMVSSFSSPSTIDMQTCGVCFKLLKERSSWGTQKIIATNELSVIAILICGHVYHAECLENMTSEINKYDPACPVCTFGEKKLLKLSEKANKSDSESKAKMNKKLRSRVVDGDMNVDDITFGRYKSNAHECRIPKMSSSSSMKSSKPFLKRHFSFGSKGSRSLSENNYSRKKGFF